MASPNVGKITIGVEFDTKGVQKQLTRDVGDALIPVIEKYNKSAVKLQQNIDNINALPMAEIAKKTNMAQKETIALIKKRDQFYEAEKRHMDLESDAEELRKKIDNLKKMVR